MSQEDLAEPSNEYQQRFMVKFKDHVRFDTSHNSLKSHPRFVMSLPEDDIEVMNLESEEEMQYWEERDDVDYIEPDQKVYLQAESIPWGITKVKALDISNNGSISSQKVRVIDSGYDIRHPDLPSSANIVSGTSQVRSEDWREDGNGHGTHVAGTIAALRGNNIGVVGVAGNGVKLHIVKIFHNDGKWTNTSNLIQALQLCVEAGSTVVNMSLGGTGYSQTANAAFSSAYNSGILLVAAAGNGGNTVKSYPGASYSSVISVAAIDRNNNLTSFSQYNDQVDLAAPGVSILSTEQIEIKTLGNDKYSLKSKTHDEMYLRVPGAGADVSAITETFVGDQEQFYILRYSTGKYTIKSAYFGNYIRGKAGEGGDVVTQTYIGTEEQFDLIPIN